MNGVPRPAETRASDLSLVAYIRREEGEGLKPHAVSVNDIKLFCAANGFSLVGLVHEEPGKPSKRFEERPAGREVMRSIREGKAQGVLVWELDQAFSSVADAVVTLERWAEEGVAFVCVSFAHGKPLIFSATSNEHAFLWHLLSGLGTFRRRVVARKVRGQLETRRAQGKWSGRVPYGFKVVEGQLTADPVKMKKISEMKRAHRRGKSYRQIAARFGISVATAHRLVKTDLRLLKRGRVPPCKEATSISTTQSDRTTHLSS